VAFRFAADHLDDDEVGVRLPASVEAIARISQPRAGSPNVGMTARAIARPSATSCPRKVYRLA
jgi:hypothetical protein